MRKRGRDPQDNPGDRRVTGRLDTASCPVALILPMTGARRGALNPMTRARKIERTVLLSYYLYIAKST
jgi:hypothetical protein